MRREVATHSTLTSGRTLATLFWLADQHGWKGWRATGRPDAQGPPIDRWQHPDLNRRQSLSARCLVGHCEGERRAAHRLGNARDFSPALRCQPQDHYPRHCSTCRPVAIFARSAARLFVRRRAATVLPVYRPVDPAMEKWLQLAQDAGPACPNGPGRLSRMAGGVWDILPPYTSY